jgi:hypothetical protein
VATAQRHRTQSRETAQHQKTQQAALTQVAQAVQVVRWRTTLAVWRALTTHGHHDARGG